MKNVLKFILIAVVAITFAACGAPAGNAPANNSNANTAKPAAAAPTKEALLDMDKKANEAYIKGDAKYFEGFLSDKFVSFEMGQRMGKAELVKMLADNKCDVKSWSLDDPQMAMVNADTAVISYKGTWDGTCIGPDGKSMKLPSPTRGASIYIRNGEKWDGAFHAETAIVDPKAPPAAPPPTPDKKGDPKKDDKAATNMNAAAPAPAKPVGDANTDALVKLHTAGWEAFKAKDAKWFNDNISASFAFVDPIGGWHGAKADIVKLWTEGMKCEGITKVAVTDGFASALSPTVEILTLKGTSDGTCDGQKNGTINQAAVYVKEGEAWKLAFMFESAAM